MTAMIENAVETVSRLMEDGDHDKLLYLAEVKPDKRLYIDSCLNWANKENAIKITAKEAYVVILSRFESLFASGNFVVEFD